MLSYSKQLSSDKWKKKREKILKRDKYSCRGCGSFESLHVHHIHYVAGLMAWQVPNEFLITLCAKCHKFEHDNNDIKSFRLSRKSKEFKEISKKYDGLKKIKPKREEKKLSLAQKVQLKKQSDIKKKKHGLWKRITM